MSKITYDNKVATKPQGVRINQFWDDDANQIKTVVNEHDDRIEQNETDIDGLKKTVLGSFGSASSTTGGDLPTSGVKVGDAYVCAVDGYVSSVAGKTFNAGETAFWDGSAWQLVETGDQNLAQLISPNGTVQSEAINDGVIIGTNKCIVVKDISNAFDYGTRVPLTFDNNSLFGNIDITVISGRSTSNNTSVTKVRLDAYSYGGVLSLSTRKLDAFSEYESIVSYNISKLYDNGDGTSTLYIEQHDNVVTATTQTVIIEYKTSSPSTLKAFMSGISTLTAISGTLLTTAPSFEIQGDEINLTLNANGTIDTANSDSGVISSMYEIGIAEMQLDDTSYKIVQAHITPQETYGANDKFYSATGSSSVLLNHGEFDTNGVKCSVQFKIRKA